MQIVFWDNLHEMPKPIFLENEVDISKYCLLKILPSNAKF